MAQVHEQIASREVKDAGLSSFVVIRAAIWEVSTEQEALIAFRNWLAANWPNGWTDGVSLGPLLVSESKIDPQPANFNNTFVWFGSATYKSPKRANQPYCVSEFDTTGGTEKINVSLQCMSNNRQDNKTRWLHGAIGVDGKGKIHGTDVVAPSYTHTLRCKVPLATVTPAYKMLLRDLTGTVNSHDILDWEGGEGLFMGARGVEAEDHWDLMLQWQVGKNFPAGELKVLEGTPYEIVVGAPDDPTRPGGGAELRSDVQAEYQEYGKLGWEYGWNFQELVENDAGGDPLADIVPRTTDVYIEKVYEYENHQPILDPLP